MGPSVTRPVKYGSEKFSKFFIFRCFWLHRFSKYQVTGNFAPKTRSSTGGVGLGSLSNVPIISIIREYTTTRTNVPRAIHNSLGRQEYGEYDVFKCFVFFSLQGMRWEKPVRDVTFCYTSTRPDLPKTISCNKM
jgi:hypothetical protein